MALQRVFYDVYLAPIGEDGTPDFTADPLEFERVEVRHQDQLRGELEGAKNGLPNVKAAPMHGASLWAWASLVRTRDYSGTYRDFKAAAIAVQGREEVEAVDPTQPGTPSDSASPSHPTSVEAPATGSTPS